MKLQGFIFDIDGTLVDSNDAHVRSWLDAFARHGKTVDDGVMRHQIGKGGDLLVPDLLNAKEMRKYGDDVRKLKGEIYKKDYLPDVKPFPGARETLEKLHDRGVRLALASSSDQEEVEYYTRLLDAERLLSASTSKSDAEFSKPSPEIFLAAVERAGSDPKLTFVAGDTPYDILAAHRIALPIVAVLCGGFERELLTKAEFIFENVREIADRITDIDGWFSD